MRSFTSTALFLLLTGAGIAQEASPAAVKGELEKLTYLRRLDTH